MDMLGGVNILNDIFILYYNFEFGWYRKLLIKYLYIIFDCVIDIECIYSKVECSFI